MTDPSRQHAASIDWSALERWLHQDPGRRGLASYCQEVQALDADQLAGAASHLAQNARCVAIVTGFCITGTEPLSAETDGPAGALYLGRTLATLGVEVTWLSDRYGLPLLEAGCRAWQLTPNLREIPLQPAKQGRGTESDWSRQFLASDLGRRLTHLISIERAGPSHTLRSLARQPRNGELPRTAFLELVPEHDRDVCHNMRGDSIDAQTAPAYGLFDQIAQQQLPITTIGIGDGGNEIGMGRFAWEDLVAALGPHSAPILCRVATDYALIAGISDWGGYALADAVACLRGRSDLLEWPLETELPRLLDALVAAGAVDGVTRQRTPTVDGLSLDTYLSVPLAIRRLLLGK